MSLNYPRDPTRNVHGSFQRMRLFAEVLAEFGDLEMLYFTPPDVDVSKAGVETARAAICRQWDLDVSLSLCPRAAPSEPSRISGFLQRCRSFRFQLPYAFTNGSRQIAAFRDRARDAKLIFAHRLNVMPAILGVEDLGPPLILDIDDVDHVFRRRELTRRPMKIRAAAELATLPAVMRGEYRAIRSSRAAFVCSEHDRQLLSRLVPRSSIRVVENAIDIPPVKPKKPGFTAVFIGSFNYGPNVEAARELIEEIWPMVLAEIPEATLRIAGRGSREQLGTLPSTGVELLGFVPDLTALYADSGIMVCPIRRGGGTRIKILEAAAHGVPVVSTTLGAEGLKLIPGRDIVLADRPDDIAKECVRLLTDRALCARIAENAHAVVARRYGRETVQSRIRQFIEEAI